MESTDAVWLNDKLALMFDGYPSSRFDAVRHGDAYWDRLKDMPRRAVEKALTDAPAESPQFAPTAMMLRAIAMREAQALYAKDRQLKLEAVVGRDADKTPTEIDREKALEAFLKKCDEILDRGWPDRAGEEHKQMLDELVVMLGACYGLPKEKMVGDKKAATPEARFSFASTIVDYWTRPTGDDSKDTRGHGLGKSVNAIVLGLRRAPAEFKTFPTEGMLRALILGEALTGFPASTRFEDRLPETIREPGQEG